MNSFPKTLPEWKNDVARRLNRLRLDINTIMMNLPMVPDPEIGMPFTGPLSPVPFVFPVDVDQSGGTPGTGGTINTGGTVINTGGTIDTVGGVCFGARFMNFTFAGISCPALNGTQKRQFNGNNFTICRWGTSFPPFATDVWYLTHDTSTNSFILVYVVSGVGGVQYSYTGFPPNAGNSVVMSLAVNTSGCTGFPATQTVTGSDV